MSTRMDTMQFPEGCLNKYRPKQLIGAGGYGRVYLAEQVDLARDVAIKFLTRDGETDDEAVARFRREARITASLRHPHIVRVLDHDIEDGQAWIAYEYLPGPCLRQTARSAPGLPWRDAVRITVQIAGALHAAHLAGIVHRDVKTANVLEGAPGEWKLADFGLARESDGDDLTEDGVLLGTLPYFAPELVDGHAATPASDIYALGATLFELLTGGYPFGHDAVHAVYVRSSTGQRPRLSEVRPDAPPVFDEVLDWMLAPAPGARPASAEVLASALEKLLRLPRRKRAASRTRTAPMPRPAPAPAHTPRLLAAGVLAVALALAGFAGSDSPAIHREPRPPIAADVAGVTD